MRRDTIEGKLVYLILETNGRYGVTKDHEVWSYAKGGHEGYWLPVKRDQYGRVFCNLNLQTNISSHRFYVNNLLINALASWDAHCNGHTLFSCTDDEVELCKTLSSYSKGQLKDILFRIKEELCRR